MSKRGIRLRLKELADIIFPRYCCCCHQLLVGDERYLCTECQLEIPYTYNAAEEGNLTEQLFEDIREVVAAMSLLKYETSSLSRNVVHEIKYHGNEHLALAMGRKIGTALRDSRRFDGVEVLIPVPLHKRKERFRGFNQSELLCRGISSITGWPIEVGVLKRVVDTESQTHKSTVERQENVASAFVVRHPDRISGRHVLLVDDVITTGSTTRACITRLIAIPGLQVSVASLALASKGGSHHGAEKNEESDSRAK